MAGRISVYGAQAMLSSYFSKGAEPPPSFFLALILNNTPTPYVSGSELDEPIGMGYQRAEIVNDLSSWTNASQPFVVGNLADVSFIPATDDWGQIRYWALCNAIAEGFVIATGAIENPLTVNTGDQVVIPEASLSFSLGPFFTVTDN